MGTSSSYSFLAVPASAFLVLGILILLLRWAFGHGSSVVARRPRPGPEGSYGLLVAIAAPGSYAEGEVIRRRLVDAGLRATLASTTDGPRVMVFPDDEAEARRVLLGP